MSETKISDTLAKLLLLLGEIYQAEIPKLTGAAEETGIPLGRILVMCQRLTEEELESTLSAARTVVNGQISLNKAAILLAYAFFWHMPFDHVFQRTDFQKATSVAMLLITSGFLHTKKVIELAREKGGCNEVGGRELYEAGLITLEQWKVTLEQALQVKQEELSLRQVLCESEDGSITGDLPAITAPKDLREKLGNILLQAGLVAEDELLCALERGLDSGEQLGEILVIDSIITALELTAALKLQGLVQEKSLTSAQAVSWLKLVPQSPGLQIVLGCAA